MPERYDLVRTTYDPVRAEQLRGVLHAELRDVAPFERKQTNVAPPEEVEVLTKNSIKSKPGTRVLALAAAVAVIGLAATVVAIGFRDSDEPGNQSPLPSTATTVAPATPPSTVPPTTTQSTVPSTNSAAFGDAEIAEATLLAEGEYAPGWVQLTLNGTAPWGAGMKMDAAIAEQVPACAPFLDAAFESPNREATVAYTFFNTTPPAPPSPEPQYVVVFPDDQAAQAMFDAVTDPAFIDGCVPGYLEQMTDPAFGDPDFVWFPFWPETTTKEPPQLNLSADQALVRAYTDQPDLEGSHFVTATVRVGRVVVHVDGLTQHANGDPAVVTSEQFQQLVSTIIDRARAALEGQPPPVTVPASTTTSPTTTTAVVLPVRLDPATDNPGFVGQLPSSALTDAVGAVVNLHGLGHETLNGLISDGIILLDGPWIESLVGCGERKMFNAHDWSERAADARSSLISAGVPESDITQDRIVSQMTSDDPEVFAFDPAEFTSFLLTCAGMPEEQAQVIASM